MTRVWTTFLSSREACSIPALGPPTLQKVVSCPLTSTMASCTMVSTSCSPWESSTSACWTWSDTPTSMALDYRKGLIVLRDIAEYARTRYPDRVHCTWPAFLFRLHFPAPEFFQVCAEEYGKYYSYNTTVGAEYTFDPQENRVLVFDSERGVKEKVCAALVNNSSLMLSLAAYDIDYDQDFEACPNLFIGRGAFRRVKALHFPERLHTGNS
ncbi:hypothetical protein MRX96_006326 [Rhipicephalus microplus]